MSYIKAEEILPEELIRRIQEYADGVYIYIPRKPGTRHPWGQKTDYKAELKVRNDRIRSDYAAGVSVMALSHKYHLSEKEHPQDSATAINIGPGAIPAQTFFGRNFFD